MSNFTALGLVAVSAFLSASSGIAADAAVPEAVPPRALSISVPPCTPIKLQANGVTGRPPLQKFWTLPGGVRLRSNPATFDPGRMAAGTYTATFTAKNSAGVATRSAQFTIEALRFRGVPGFENLGDRQVRATAQTEGATELQWVWGDGASSRWLPVCDALRLTHRYPRAGNYTLRARARNCRDAALQSPPVTIQVTALPDPKILGFAAQGCTLGFCLFAPGTTVRFDQSFKGSPAAYLYDWDGNGTFEEVAGAPVLTHVYSRPGIYSPVLRVTSGARSATFRHAALVLVE